jgi:uncharacterized protein (DUF58 family)
MATDAELLSATAPQAGEAVSLAGAPVTLSPCHLVTLPPRRASWQLPAGGRCWLLTAALMLGVGLFKNINLLTLLGYVLFVVFVLNALLAGRRVRYLRAVRATSEPVFAGSPCAVEVQLSNPGPPGGSSPDGVSAVRLEERGAEHALAWFIERLGRGEVARLRGEVVLRPRGPYAWGPLVALGGRPFGLVRRRVLLAEPREVVVLPRLGWLHRGLLRRRLRSAAAPGERIQRPAGEVHRSAMEEFHGLRPFRTGDSPRAIHWRTSARRGELMVREYEDLPGDDLLLVFDPSAPATPEQFEAAVSLAATICWEWCRQRGDRLILATAGPRPTFQDGLTGPEHGRRLLTTLALVQPADSCGDTRPACEPAREPRAATDAAPDLPAELASVAGSVAVVVVAGGPSKLADRLRQRLHRPVTCLDASRPQECEFYREP